MRKQRLYSLFERGAVGQWVRLTEIALPLKYARQVWQDALLSAALRGGRERRLRPVKS